MLLAAALAPAGATVSDPPGASRKVVTSTTDLADLAKAVGGSRVDVVHISEGYQDPHFVEAKPSFMLRLRDADVFAFVGLDLEVGWMSLLVDGSRNPRIRPGSRGYIDVSRAIPVLDVPAGQIDRSQGDVHPLGNPHYWLDPANARRIARLFAERFAELDHAGADTYEANRRSFEERLSAAERGWAAARAKIRGKPIVAWHTSWRYFASYSGADIVGFMEPKPGVPPSPSHLAGLILTMQRTGAKVIVMEPFYQRKTADFVASKTGARVLVLPPSVGGIRGVDDYIALMRHNLTTLAAAIP
jgi:ABC-type Zn uptake system ZnuABC Zn-binding protein ZnuA